MNTGSLSITQIVKLILILVNKDERIETDSQNQFSVSEYLTYTKMHAYF